MTIMETDTAGEKLAAILRERAEKELPLGLHINLDFPKYLADKGLGSSDLKDLSKSAVSYWYGSWMNPLRPSDDDTEARLIGRAMHKRVLEGKDWFDRHYMRGPDQDGMSTAEKTASTKAAKARAAAIGRDCLKAPAYDRIVQAHAMITRHPDLAAAFSDGYPEISFIWMRNGVRLKMRPDYLKTVMRGGNLICGIGDLKSAQNENGDDFEQVCYNAISRWSYHIQTAHYLEGARHFADAIKEGLVHWHGDVKRDDKFIDRLSKCKTAAWQFVFHQSTGAPNTFSMVVSPGSKFIEKGRASIEIALERYKEYLARYGTDMWIDIKPVHEAEIERMPPWFDR